jgi:hypothetical protein
MNGHLIESEIVVDEETSALIDHKRFHQRRACAHRHCADDLAARGRRV